MLYIKPFVATDDADWAQAVQIIDDATSLPLDISAAALEISVLDSDGCTALSASTDAGTLTRPDANTIQWRFTEAQMNGLRINETYKVGCRMTTDAGTEQVFVARLILKGGGFR